MGSDPLTHEPKHKQRLWAGPPLCCFAHGENERETERENEGEKEREHM